MYKSNETPLIAATILYYDVEYKQETVLQVKEILERNGMYPPACLCADHLTNNNFAYYDEKAEQIFIDAFSETDVTCVDCYGKITKQQEGVDYWRILWAFMSKTVITKCPSSSSFLPWNVLTIYSTYERLKKPEAHIAFLRCMQELLDLLHPFYAYVDDVANGVSMRHRRGRSKLSSKRIETIYWANFWGESYFENFDFRRIEGLPAEYKIINNGIYFALTDSLFDFGSLSAKLARCRIKFFLRKEQCKMKLKRLWDKVMDL